MSRQMANKHLPTTPTLFLLTLSVFILVSATLSIANADSDLVLDIDGNPLEVGSRYYMKPTNIGFSGVIGRSARSGPGIPCPLYATVFPTAINRGDPLKIVPLDNTQNQIHLSSVVVIDSGFSAYCRDVGLWRLSYDVFNRSPVVIAAGIFKVGGNRFTIEKAEGQPSYKIAASPAQPAQGGLIRYLTVFHDFQSRKMLMLGLTDDPTQALQVEFHKYKEDVVASI